MMFEWQSRFAPLQKVYIDGDKSIKAVVTGIYFTLETYKVECSWFHQGCVHRDYFEEWRISLVQEGD